MPGNFNWPLPILGSAGIGTASPCPKCGGRRTHSYSRSYPASPLDHDVIRCEDCGYNEYLQADGTHATGISFDGSKRQETRSTSMEGLIEGRIVHFVMNGGTHRPAIVVRVWNKESGVSNLQVFTDGSNDVRPNDESESMNAAIESGMLWRTSIPFSEDPEPNTWHWIEKA